jgi:hypothetical protein
MPQCSVPTLSTLQLAEPQADAQAHAAEERIRATLARLTALAAACALQLQSIGSADSTTAEAKQMRRRFSRRQSEIVQRVSRRRRSAACLPACLPACACLSLWAPTRPLPRANTHSPSAARTHVLRPGCSHATAH